MSEYDSSNGDGGGEEAASVLARAIYAVRSQPLNEDSLEQTLARVRSRASAPRSMRRHFRGPIFRRWLLAGGAAVAAVDRHNPRNAKNRASQPGLLWSDTNPLPSNRMRASAMRLDNTVLSAAKRRSTGSCMGLAGRDAGATRS